LTAQLGIFLRISRAPEEQLTPFRDLGHDCRVDAVRRPLGCDLDDVPAGLDEVSDAHPIAGVASIQAVVCLADPLDRQSELGYGSIDAAPSPGDVHPVLAAACGQAQLLPLTVHALLPLIGARVEPRQSFSQHGPKGSESAAAGAGVLL
jgi:hypothetical protein